MPKQDFILSTAREPRIKRAIISASSSGDNVLVAAVPNKIIRVYQILLIAAGSVVVDFQSNSATDISGPLPLTSSVGFSTSWSPVGHFQTLEGQALTLNLNSATVVGGWFTYAEV